MQLSDSVVVITGASSGIGRCAARMFAQQGATTVLAARRMPALEEVVKECGIMGGNAIAVRTDVSREEDVEALAARALERFGRIDVWVNNAAVTLFGRFEETPAEVYDQVIKTNVFGYIYGARAALPIFREQGRGTLVNVASMVSYVGQPYTSAYVTSKHALRGFGECLRMELMDERNINVCTVLPATIDTPLFQHAGNYTGRAAKAMEPVYPAEAVASTIVQLARRPQREVVVGAAGRMLMRQHTIAPATTERMMARMVHRNHLSDQPAPATPGNIIEPMPEWTGVSGNWRREPPAQSRGAAKRLPALAALLIPAGVLLWQHVRANGKSAER